MVIAYQGWDEIDTGHVVDVVDLHVAPDALVPATLDRTLEYMRVVEVLHRLRAKVDAQMLQLARLRILETEHVQDPDEPIRRVSYRVVQRSHASGTGTTCAWHEKIDTDIETEQISNTNNRLIHLFFNFNLIDIYICILIPIFPF